MTRLVRWRVTLILLGLASPAASFLMLRNVADNEAQLIPYFAYWIVLVALTAWAAREGSLVGLGCYWAALTWCLLSASIFGVMVFR